MSEQLKKLLSVRPETLAKTQHEELTEFSVNLLREVIKLLKKSDYEGLKKYITGATSCGYDGSDNSYICFSDAFEADFYASPHTGVDSNGVDISMLISELSRLNDIAVVAK